MPTYEITSPDGRTFEVTAPEGASQSQVLAYAQSQWKASPKKAETIDPTEGMSTGKRLLAGIGQGMTDLGYGVGQRLGLVDQATIDEKKKLDSPLLKTGAGMVGSIGGKIAGALPAALIPGANTMAGAALIGAGQGFIEPTATGESVLKNVALGAGGAAGGVAVGRGLKAGYQGARALVEPFTAAGQQKIAGRVLERFAENPQALRAASSARTATGAMPTLAEASKDRGIAALERSIASQDPQIAASLAQRAADNNAARVGVIQSLAGDPAKMAQAVAARKAATDPIYAVADDAVVQIDSSFQSLLKRPAFAKAVQDADTLARNDGLADIFFRNSQGQPVAMTGQGAHYIKKVMDDAIQPGSASFAGQQASKSVANTQRTFLGWLEKTIPEYGAARSEFSKLSKPVNQMEVGQRLLDKTTASLRDMGGNSRLMANSFAKALDDESALVRASTGLKGGQGLGDILEPGQLQGLNAVRSELELGADLARAANGPGSQTAKSLASQNLMRQMIGPTGLPQSWAESTMLSTLARPVQFGMQAAEPRIQETLAKIMLDPVLARKALEAAQPSMMHPVTRGLLDFGQNAATRSVPAGLLTMSR